jgi:hypothetical protein
VNVLLRPLGLPVTRHRSVVDAPTDADFHYHGDDSLIGLAAALGWQGSPGRVTAIAKPPPRARRRPIARLLTDDLAAAAAVAKHWPGAEIALRVSEVATHRRAAALAQAGRPAWRDRLFLQAAAMRERSRLRLARHILTPSAAHCDEISAFAPELRNRLRCVPDRPLRVRRVAEAVRQGLRRGLGLGRGDRVVVWLPTEGPGDGEYLLREAASAGSRVRVLLVDQRSLRVRLGCLAARLGISERLVWTPTGRLGEAIACCDVAVSTATYDMAGAGVRSAIERGAAVLAPRHRPPHVFSGMAATLESAGAGRTYGRGKPGALCEAIRG